MLQDQLIQLLFKVAEVGLIAAAVWCWGRFRGWWTFWSGLGSNFQSIQTSVNSMPEKVRIEVTQLLTEHDRKQDAKLAEFQKKMEAQITGMQTGTDARLEELQKLFEEFADDTIALREDVNLMFARQHLDAKQLRAGMRMMARNLFETETGRQIPVAVQGELLALFSDNSDEVPSIRRSMKRERSNYGGRRNRDRPERDRDDAD